MPSLLNILCFDLCDDELDIVFVRVWDFVYLCTNYIQHYGNEIEI